MDAIMASSLPVNQRAKRAEKNQGRQRHSALRRVFLVPEPTKIDLDSTRGRRYIARCKTPDVTLWNGTSTWEKEGGEQVRFEGMMPPKRKFGFCDAEIKKLHADGVMGEIRGADSESCSEPGRTNVGCGAESGVGPGVGKDRCRGRPLPVWMRPSLMVDGQPLKREVDRPSHTLGAEHGK